MERRFAEVQQSNLQLQELLRQAQQDLKAVALKASQTNPNGPTGCQCRDADDVCSRCEKLANANVLKKCRNMTDTASRYRRSWHETQATLGRQQQKAKHELDAQKLKSQKEIDAIDAELKRFQDMYEEEKDSGLRDPDGNICTESRRYRYESDKATEYQRKFEEERKLRLEAEFRVCDLLTNEVKINAHIDELKRVAERNHEAIVDEMQNKIDGLRSETDDLQAKLAAKDAHIIHLHEGVWDDAITHPPSSDTTRPTLPEFKSLFSASSNPLCTGATLKDSPMSSSAPSIMRRRENFKKARSAECNPLVIKQECSKLVRDSHIVFVKALKNIGGPSIAPKENRSKHSSSLRRFIRNTAKIYRERSRAQHVCGGDSIPHYQTTYGVSPW